MIHMVDQIDKTRTDSLRRRGDTITTAYRNSATGALYYSTTGPLDRPSLVSAEQQNGGTNGGTTPPDDGPVTPPITDPSNPEHPEHDEWVEEQEEIAQRIEEEEANERESRLEAEEQEAAAEDAERQANRVPGAFQETPPLLVSLIMGIAAPGVGTAINIAMFARILSNNKKNGWTIDVDGNGWRNAEFDNAGNIISGISAEAFLAANRHSDGPLEGQFKGLNNPSYRIVTPNLTRITPIGVHLLSGGNRDRDGNYINEDGNLVNQLGGVIVCPNLYTSNSAIP